MPLTALATAPSFADADADAVLPEAVDEALAVPELADAVPFPLPLPFTAAGTGLPSASSKFAHASLVRLLE